MGCNCKTTKKILEIHKDYGYKKNVSWKEKTKFTTGEMFMRLLVIILLTIFFPIIFFMVFFQVLFGKRNFNINNILRILLRKNKNG